MSDLDEGWIEIGLPNDEEQRFQAGMRLVCLGLGVIIGFFSAIPLFI